MFACMSVATTIASHISSLLEAIAVPERVLICMFKIKYTRWMSPLSCTDAVIYSGSLVLLNSESKRHTLLGLD